MQDLISFGSLESMLFWYTFLIHTITRCLLVRIIKKNNHAKTLTWIVLLATETCCLNHSITMLVLYTYQIKTAQKPLKTDSQDRPLMLPEYSTVQEKCLSWKYTPTSRDGGHNHYSSYSECRASGQLANG